MYPMPTQGIAGAQRGKAHVEKTATAKLRRKTAPGVHEKLEAGLHSGGGICSAKVTLQPAALEPGAPRRVPDSTALPG